MNRENKKKSFDKGYYKTHPCNESFVCKVCGRTVVPDGAGSEHRNHCPYCLWSKHVDLNPGDRASKCQGLMKPLRVEKDNDGYVLVHRCQKCGYEKRNKTSEEDNFEEIINLAKANHENCSE